MASTKFVTKFKRNKNQNQTKDEFFVNSKSVCIAQQYKDKIETMYEITVHFENEAEGGQWLVLEGEQLDRRNAKNYITALCNPVERKQVQFPSSTCMEFTDPITIENIEKQTNAFIRPLLKVGQFEISGTELAVTLAMSQMEELAGPVTDDDIVIVGDDADNDILTISPANQNASSRLSDHLQRALSEHSDGVCSVEDYLQAPNAVKRVLVNCLQDNEVDSIDDDDQLFADGATNNSDSKQFKLRIFDAADHDSSVSDGMTADNPPMEGITTSPVGALSDKLTAAVNIDSTEDSTVWTKQQQYLHSFGVTVGYNEKDVLEALKFVEDKTRPSDFLDIVSKIADNPSDNENEIPHASGESDDDVVILGTEDVIMDGEKETVTNKSEFPPVASLKAAVSAGSKQLPEGYKERLLADFIQEDESCSVDDLKKRNAERQKLLRQNFEKQNMPTNESSTQNSQAQKKNKKKKKKKQQQDQCKDQGSKQVDKKEMPHDKQFKLDPQDGPISSDADQTCVMKVWNKDQPDPCAAPNTTSNQFTPKRKQSQNFNQWGAAGRPNSTPQGQPIQGLNQWPVVGNPSVAPPYNMSWQQPPIPQPHTQGYVTPNKGKQWKPTQVVTPVSMYPGTGDPQPAPVQSEDALRYIVIDGSNVAMTHGNGKFFSCKGLRLVVDYFKQRGHKQITVFVPQWRTYKPSAENQIYDQNILYELKDEDHLVFTPSRRIGRKLVVAYDDRFVLELAEAEDGIVVSNDQYRDLMTEKASWKKLIEERLLMFTFVSDRFMPPNDPLGRDGPSLDYFLSKSKKQPYTEANRPFNQYNYQHPQQNVQYNKGQGQSAGPPGPSYHDNLGYNRQGQKFKTPVQRQFNNQYDDCDAPPQQYDQDHVKGWKVQKGQGNSFKGKGQKSLLRTEEETEQMYRELKIIFPEEEQEEKIRKILANHESEKDLAKLTNYLMSILFN